MYDSGQNPVDLTTFRQEKAASPGGPSRSSSRLALSRSWARLHHPQGGDLEGQKQRILPGTGLWGSAPQLTGNPSGSPTINCPCRKVNTRTFGKSGSFCRSRCEAASSSVHETREREVFCCGSPMCCRFLLIEGEPEGRRPVMPFKGIPAVQEPIGPSSCPRHLRFRERPVEELCFPWLHT